MEVMMPPTGIMESSRGEYYNIESACTSPYISAPSSPPRFGTLTPFFSAPTSPSRGTTTTTTGGGASLSTVPFNWEEKPGIAKTTQQHNYSYHHHQTITDNDTDFAFDFSGQLEKSLLSADELFDGGKIKPLKPPPRVLYESKTGDDTPKSPKSPKKMFKEAFSPKHKSKDFDPFAAAIENTRHENNTIKESSNDHQRGRERRPHNSSNISSTSRDKGSRSLSPFRVSDLLFDQEKGTAKVSNTTSSSSTSTSSNSSFTSSWYRKWKLKDLLLFRSASEGRATSKAQLNKYAMLKKTNQEDDVKNASFRSTDSVGSGSRRRSEPVSAHELHYTTNRAVSEEMKRKTFLPYKQGLLGCLGFNPAINEISRGIGSMNRG